MLFTRPYEQSTNASTAHLRYNEESTEPWGQRESLAGLSMSWITRLTEPMGCRFEQATSIIGGLSRLVHSARRL